MQLQCICFHAHGEAWAWGEGEKERKFKAPDLEFPLGTWLKETFQKEVCVIRKADQQPELFMKGKPTSSSAFPTWPWLARAFFAIAFLLGLYLFWVSWTQGGLAGCGPGSSCQEVLMSRWGYWFGVPVGLLGAVLYAAVLVATWFLYSRVDHRPRKRGWLFAIGGAFGVLMAAIWFVALQGSVLGQFCRWCLLTHGFASAGALVLLWNAPLQKMNVRHAKGKGTIPSLPTFTLPKGLLLGLGLVAFLAAGQMASRGAGAVVDSTPGATSTSAEGGSGSTDRVLTLHNGQFPLEVNELPVMGNRSASHLLVSLFDYTCPHCRIMHGHLKEAMGAFPGQLGAVSLPVPLSADCNELMRRRGVSTPAKHAQSCDYARLGLAVWRANPDAFDAFDDWMFASSSTPSLERARGKAAELIGGRDKLEAALAEDWIEQRLKEDVAIYEANFKETGKSAMPQLMVGDQITSGNFKSSAELVELLQKEWGLEPSGSL